MLVGLSTFCLFTLMGLNIGTPQTNNFPFGTNEMLMVIGVPIPMHILDLLYGTFSCVVALL